MCINSIIFVYRGSGPHRFSALSATRPQCLQINLPSLTKSLYVSRFDSGLWVHGLRGLRASHLVRERGFDVFNLTRWFNWKSADMAIHYTQSKDMAKILDIPEIPV